MTFVRVQQQVGVAFRIEKNQSGMIATSELYCQSHAASSFMANDHGCAVHENHACVICSGAKNVQKETSLLLIVDVEGRE